MTTPTMTPWGPIQQAKQIAQGITQVSTKSHGGYLLTPERIAQMPPALRCGLDDLYFEEDCQWCFVVLSFPHEFPPSLHEEAIATCNNYYPEQWEAWMGTSLPLDESQTKRQAHWNHQHQDDFVVIAAWGDWHRDVPKGYVGVCATRGGRRAEPPAHQHYFLVPQEDYSIPCVVDLTKHQAIAPITTAS